MKFYFYLSVLFFTGCAEEKESSHVATDAAEIENAFSSTKLNNYAEITDLAKKTKWDDPIKHVYEPDNGIDESGKINGYLHEAILDALRIMSASGAFHNKITRIVSLTEIKSIRITEGTPVLDFSISSQWAPEVLSSNVDLNGSFSGYWIPLEVYINFGKVSEGNKGSGNGSFTIYLAKDVNISLNQEINIDVTDALTLGALSGAKKILSALKLLDGITIKQKIQSSFKLASPGLNLIDIFWMGDQKKYLGNHNALTRNFYKNVAVPLCNIHKDAKGYAPCDTTYEKAVDRFEASQKEIENENHNSYFMPVASCSEKSDNRIQLNFIAPKAIIAQISQKKTFKKLKVQILKRNYKSDGRDGQNVFLKQFKPIESNDLTLVEASSDTVSSGGCASANSILQVVQKDKLLNPLNLSGNHVCMTLNMKAIDFRSAFCQGSYLGDKDWKPLQEDGGNEEFYQEIWISGFDKQTGLNDVDENLPPNNTDQNFNLVNGSGVSIWDVTNAAPLGFNPLAVAIETGSIEIIE